MIISGGPSRLEESAKIRAARSEGAENLRVQKSFAPISDELILNAI